MTVVTINRLTFSGIFSVKLTFENTEMSEMNPREETSTVLFKSLHLENSGNKFWFKVLYFELLNCFDAFILVSWQIVNSNVEIIF